MERKIKTYTLIIFILFFSCENSTTKKRGPSYFNVNFSNDWYTGDKKAFVFISDPNGDVIESKSFRGNKSVTFYEEDLLGDIPEKVNMTIVRPVSKYDNYRFTTYMELETYKDVNIVGEGFYYNQNKDYNIKLSNSNTDIRSAQMSSSTSSSTWVKSEFTGIDFTFEKKDNLFITLDYIDDSKKYIFTDKIKSDSEIDVSSPESMSKINFDNIFNHKHWVFWSIEMFPNKFYFIGSSSTYFNNYVTDFDLYYPAGLDKKYRISARYNRSDTEYYYNESYGHLNQDKTIIDAEFAENGNPQFDVDISVSGEIDYIKSVFFKNQDGKSVSWAIYGPGDITKYDKPKIPENVKDKSGVTSSNFKMNTLTLANDYEISSYESFIETKLRKISPYHSFVTKQRAFIKYYDIF